MKSWSQPYGVQDKERSSAGCNQQFPATGMDILGRRYSKQVPCDTSHKECGRRVITNRSSTSSIEVLSILQQYRHRIDLHIDTDSLQSTRTDTRADTDRVIRTVDTNLLPRSDTYSRRYVQSVRIDSLQSIDSCTTSYRNTDRRPIRRDRRNPNTLGFVGGKFGAPLWSHSSILDWSIRIGLFGFTYWSIYSSISILLYWILLSSYLAIWKLQDGC